MTRVSDNSTTASILHSMRKAKARLEEGQLKGTSLKSMIRPSDSPANAVESLSISTKRSDTKQFLRNISYANTQLNILEKSVEQLTELLVKAKEIAIAQASDLFGEDIRQNISQEVRQLKNHALSIANRRVGQKYLFAGFKTLTKPFTEDGKYHGDKGKINLEVSKDFYIPANLNGAEVFLQQGYKKVPEHPLKDFPKLRKQQENQIPGDQLDKIPDVDSPSRDLASKQKKKPDESAQKAEPNTEWTQNNNIIANLESLAVALETNDSALVRGLLERFDDNVDHLIGLRTKVGSLQRSAISSQNALESEDIVMAARKSKISDADMAELFSDMQKNKAILEATYRASQGVINKNILDFMNI